MSRLIAVFAALAILTGCATIDTAAKRVTDRVCALEPVERDHLRHRLDRATDPHAIRVECGE